MHKNTISIPGLQQNSLLVNHPEAMSTVRRSTEWSITLVGWLVWVFLCRPALMAMLWFFGFELFYEHMVRLGGMTALFDFTVIYIIEIVVIYLILRMWNFYNFRLFKGKDRRRTEKIVDQNDLQNFFHFPTTCVDQIQQADQLDIHFLPNNRFRVDAGSSPDASHEGRFKSS